MSSHSISGSPGWCSSLSVHVGKKSIISLIGNWYGLPSPNTSWACHWVCPFSLTTDTVFSPRRRFNCKCTCVSIFFTVCCFPAAGVGPLAAARDPAAERDRTCLCHGACPWLLLPTATTAPVQGPSLAHSGTRSSSLLRASLVPPRRRWVLRLAPVPSVLLVHCDDAGDAAGPSSASSGHAVSSR